MQTHVMKLEEINTLQKALEIEAFFNFACHLSIKHSL